VTLHHHASPAQATAWLRGCVRGALRTDSRAVQPGDGFIAWPGQATDGRRFVPQALQAGAVACLVEADGVETYAFDDARVAALPGLKAATGVVADEWFDHPSRALTMVATTGTNGKTSTALWMAQAQQALGRPFGVVGTLGLGLPGQLEATGLTTPDPLRLHGALRRFADAGLAGCAMEASSIGIAEERLAAVKIDVAMFTNFTQDHLDYHGSMGAYWAAKRRLFDWPGLQAAVVNIDDDHGLALAEALQPAGLPVWTVALHRAARLRGRDLHYVDGGLVFEVIEGDRVVTVSSRLVGEFNASNLLVVLGGLRALGVPLADAAAVVPALDPVPGRVQRVGADHPARPAVVVDYAHTPDALQKVLQALRPWAVERGGRLWCVFGCGGDRDPVKRPLMGAIADRLADRVVLTSDNPRSEPPDFILAQILAGVTGRDEVAVIADRAQAIAHAVAQAAPQDVVVIAGKGHEDYQEVAGERRPFSDAVVALAELGRRAGGACP